MDGCASRRSTSLRWGGVWKGLLGTSVAKLGRTCAARTELLFSPLPAARGEGQRAKRKMGRAGGGRIAERSGRALSAILSAATLRPAERPPHPSLSPHAGRGSAHRE